MISPKEKAEQLIKRFQPHSNFWDCYNDEPLEENHAKNCALICVEEIIESYNNSFESLSINSCEYWATVRTEILNAED